MVDYCWCNFGSGRSWLVCGPALIFPAKGSETAKVEKGSISEELILSGEVKAEHDAVLKFSTAGKIAWIGVTEGQEVANGRALAKLDTTNLNSALQKARSDLRVAEVTKLLPKKTPERPRR